MKHSLSRIGRASWLAGVVWVVAGLAAQEVSPGPGPGPEKGPPPLVVTPPPGPLVTPPTPVALPTQVVLVAPFGLTHAHYSWQQVTGAPVVLPPETGATARIDLPPPGSYAWEVSGGDGRLATPPVTVRLVVLADAASGRWALPYPERLQLTAGDPFVIDLRGITVAAAGSAAGVEAGNVPSKSVVPPRLATIDWSREWSVVWGGIQAGGEGPAGAAERLTAWSPGAPLGPRLRQFGVPANTPAGTFTLNFRLLLNAGKPDERELHAGSIRLEVTPAANGAAGGVTAGAGATTQVVHQPVPAQLAAATVGPGAPVIALPYGEQTVTVRLNEAVALDGRLCTDPDNDRLTYRWWQTRAPWSEGSGDGVVGTTSFAVGEHPALWRWQPTLAADLGLHEFVLSVSDGQNLVYSRPVKVKVEPAAATPRAQLRVTAGPGQVIEVGQETRLDVKVEQFENGGWLPRYAGVEPRWAQKSRPPGILRIDPAEAMSAFQPYFRADAPGLYELEFSVAAGENLSNTATVRVQVVAGNRPPVWLFEDTPAVSGRVGEPLTLSLPARDPDGDALKFELRRLEGPAAAGAPEALEAVAGVQDGVTTMRLNLPRWPAGMYVIGAAVSDGRAFSSTQEALVWIREPARFGPFVIVGSTTVAAGQTARFEVTGAGANSGFIDWRAAGAETRWQSAREGARVAVRCDQPGTVDLTARVADGLGRVTPVTLAVQVVAAAPIAAAP